MTNLTISTDSVHERNGNYARVRRVGSHVYVSGTGAFDANGNLHAPGDTYAQAIHIYQRVEGFLAEVGASMHDVVRTRAYVSDMTTINDYVRAHGDVFDGILPAAIGVGAELLSPEMMVEVEVEAIVAD